MVSPVPVLAPKLAEALSLFRESGIEPTAEEIVWLAELRRACDRPVDGSVPWLMGAGLEFSGVTFWPLHRLSEVWYSRALDVCGMGNDQLVAAIYLFAHAKSAPGDTSLRDLATEKQITDAVMAWYDSLPIHGHADQLEALCVRLSEIDGDTLTVPDPDREQKQPECSGDGLPSFVALACRAFPSSRPDFWLTEMPSSAVREMIASVSNESDGWATHPKRTAAIANWLKAVKWVWRNHSE